MTPQELKNSILQLAIQGRLVEQRPEERVDNSYIKLQKNKQIEEMDYEIPCNWSVGTLESICEIIPTKQYQILENQVVAEGIYPVVSQSKEYKIGYCNDTSKLYTVENSVIVFGDHTTEVKYIDFDFVVGADGVKVFKPNEAVLCKYIYYILQLITKEVGKIGGYTRHYKFIKNKPIPLPPLAEQKRIVAKIEELLPYIDRYEQAWSKLEDFNKKFPTDMQKSILQMAIQGKLVEQHPQEGTAEELYVQIQAEKAQLIKDGKIKKQKPLPEITEDEVPFEIPESWKWVRLPDIGELNRGKSKHRPRNAPELYINGTTPMIQTGDVARANKYITEWSSMYNDVGVAQSRIWETGTLCMTIAANIGDVAILSFDACFPDSVVGFNAYNPILDNEFFLYGLMCYKNILDAMSRSTAQKNINLEIISNVAFPLPPLAEQQRIVAKLEEILPLCEGLK